MASPNTIALMEERAKLRAGQMWRIVPTMNMKCEICHGFLMNRNSSNQITRYCSKKCRSHRIAIRRLIKKGH